MMHHSLERTSPKGGPYIGKCTLCGKEGITIAKLMTERCSNPNGVSQSQVLLDAIEGPKTAETTEKGTG